MRTAWTATVLLPGLCRGLSSAREHVLVRDGFLGAPARELRRAFERRFDPPESGVLGPERFAWDVWHVPGQWSLLRSPAESYFCDFGDGKAYDAFDSALRSFALREFGCSNVSPVWLSLYTDGAFQGLHTDAWQGPWSFVYSLTDWDNRGFEGGETLLLGDQVLQHWRSFEMGASAEEKQLTRQIEPLFDRLTVFDPRYPHCVRPLRGSRDPLKGRLVLHGWFIDPAPYFEGPLDEDDAAEVISQGATTRSRQQSVKNVVVRVTLPCRFDSSGRLPLRTAGGCSRLRRPRRPASSSGRWERRVLRGHSRRYEDGPER
eukprot:scaffold7072_cov267-Pinguiococcus_pyrenoidosus.AAC.13